MTKSILLLGNPKLHEISKVVENNERNETERIVKDLHNAMMDFRKKHKRGRAIAAPQIGELKRLIYINIDNQPLVLINPVFTWKSNEMIELWDDCMSLPNLFVKVKRYKACTVSFYDLDWKQHEMTLNDDLSELIQHEYDHLDGTLITARAIDNQSFALYSEKKYISFDR